MAVALILLLAVVKDQPLWVALGGLVGVMAGAYVSIRLVKPRSRQIVAQAGDFDSQRWDRLMQRYEVVVQEQDTRLAAYNARIDELEQAERDCETRADVLQARVDALEKRVGEDAERIAALLVRRSH